jgi:F-type H+-transporting ATPase subunit epsilon
VPFELTIVTPRGRAFSGSADAVTLPGTEGEFTVMPQHERFLTPLKVGELSIKRGGETLRATISDGFAEVRGDAVNVLVESCTFADGTRLH